MVAAAGISAAAATAGVHGGPAIVRVTLSDTGVLLSPQSVISGDVVFKIANRSRTPRDFEVGGKRTPIIPAGKTGTLSGTLEARPYRYVSVGNDRSVRLTGFVGVLPACTRPTETTVTADITINQITLSQTTVPCGTVTFTVSNSDVSDTHDLNFALPTVQGGQRFGSRLKPGQSAKMVVNLPYKGKIYYFCNEPEHAENGESGFLTVR